MEKIKTLIKNRKAQIGATLTWIVAYIIIFFIIIIFLSATITIASSKKAFDAVSGAVSSIFSGKSDINYYSVSETENIISVLNYKNGKLSVREAIINSIKPYFDEQEGEKFIFYTENSGLTVFSKGSEFDTAWKTDKMKQEAFDYIAGILNSRCGGYIIGLPQGFILNNKDKTAYLDDSSSPESMVGKETLIKNYNPYYSIVPFLYKGYILKIKYLEERKCEKKQILP